MGATFIELELESLAGSGGYAKEMTAERTKQQQDLLTPFIAKSNVVITTAAVPGRPAPRLMTKAMIDSMSPGSVIIDLAAETGGNAEGSVAGETIVTDGGVIIWGGKDVPSSLPFHASSLYSRNLLNLLTLITVPAKDEEKVALNINFEDEIVTASALTHNGSRRNS
jgi:NAD(P) transhydrogenase subunit alpha